MNGYLLAKHIHVACVVLSITGFALRFLLSLRRPQILRIRWVRVAPHANDTILLGAAIAMLWIAGWNVLEMPWLLAKIAGLLAYVVLGMIALRFGRTRAARVAAFAAALAAFAYVVAVALTKQVAGPFAVLAG